MSPSFVVFCKSGEIFRTSFQQTYVSLLEKISKTEKAEEITEYFLHNVGLNFLSSGLFYNSVEAGVNLNFFV